MSSICYLDFDGVTHNNEVYWSPNEGIYLDTPGRGLFEWLPILEALLAPYPLVKIVLSTSWVRAFGFEFAKQQLTASLQARVIGATFRDQEMHKSSFDNMSRGMQICADVGRRKPARWFAIDNDDRGWPKRCRDHLIKTEDYLGLSDPGVQKSIRRVLASF